MPSSAMHAASRAGAPAAAERALALFSAGKLAETLALAERGRAQGDATAALLNVGAAAAAMLGDGACAEACWLEAIGLQPDHVAAHFNLGMLLLQTGRPQRAAAALHAVLALEPDHAQARLHLGAALQAAGCLDEADAAYRQAADRHPDLVAAHLQRGNLCRQRGRLDEAQAAYRTALAIRPDDADAHNNLGIVLQEAGACAPALEAYDRSLALRPGHAPTHNNRALLLHALGRDAEAEAAYRAALALQPDLADTHFNLGNLYRDTARAQEAEDAYRRTLALQAGHVPACNHLALLMIAARRYDEAAAALQAALAMRGDHASTLNNLGLLLQEAGQADAAGAAYRRALELAPDLPEAHRNLGALLQDARAFDDAQAHYRRALASRPADGAAAAAAYHAAGQGADWSLRAEDEARLVRLVRQGIAVAPFALLHLDAADAPALQARNARCYAREQGWHTGAGASAGRPPAPRADRRLRIGYLSGDFHEHATLQLLMGVLAAHDRARFAIHAYSYGAIADAATQRAAACCDGFHDLRQLGDAPAAARIAADGIDILVDLKGYTAGNRLGIGARRPAPVLVSWLGYPGTLGEPRLADYLIGDPIVTPPQDAAHFSETLALMPHCYQPNDRQRAIGTRPARADVGLPADAFVFCSFNQCVKLNPATVDAWCRLLHAVPAGVLWLLAPPAPAIARLRAAFGAGGIDPQRLVFAPARPLAEHLGRLQLADLALDTYPYGSHTTGSDALWAGVPLVAHRGASFASRVSSSLLHAAGLPELVTTGWDDTVALATALARDGERLAGLRRRLADGRDRAPLFDTARFTRDLERLLAAIWEQHGSGERRLIALAAD
jgi:predicted O-linked N-acetylglucosamine transferase (SPINDLY family)